MLASLTANSAASLLPSFAELTSQDSPTQVNPTSLQLMLIGLGTIAVYSLAKRLRASRHQRRGEVARQALAAVAAATATPAPHFDEQATPVLTESAEHAA
jgi:hypothetical protein